MPMPPFVDTVGAMLRVTQAFLYPTGVGGQQVEEVNTNWVCTAAGGGDSRLALITLMDSFLAPIIRPALPTTTKYYGSKAGLLNMHPPPLAMVTTPDLAGTAPSATPLPTQTRGLVRWSTAVGGRKGRGRIYMPTPEVSFMDVTGSPTAAYHTIIENYGASLLGGMTVGGSNWYMVIAHRSAPPPPFTYTWDIVTARLALNTWCTQRRSGESGRPNATPW